MGENVKTKFKIMVVLMLLTAFPFTACDGDGDDASTPAVKPAAAEVKAVYDQVNDDVNFICRDDVNTGNTAEYSYLSGKLSVKVTATSGTVYPLNVVYTLSNFDCGLYTISGSATTIVTAPDYWTSTGTLTAIDGDISTMYIDMARNGDPNVMTGTLIVNGYEYDYATVDYK